jgi:hypothetical protein
LARFALVLGASMPALFPPWSNTATRVVLVSFAAGAVLTVVLLWMFVRSPYVTNQHVQIEQPVAFDHRHHVRDDGIACLYCHKDAEKTPFAGLPPTELCMGCHDQIWNQSALLAPVRDSFFSGRPIPWVRVHSLPGFVYFDHSIHVGKGVGCESCHGRIDLMPEVEQVASLQMGWCLDCHRDPTPRLRPRAHITDMGWVATRDDEKGPELARRYHVRSLTYCSTCHR